MHPRLDLDTIILVTDDKRETIGANRLTAEAPAFSELEVVDERGSTTKAPVVSRGRPGGGLVTPTE
ncbi:MAG: hypothetical protein QF654_01700 [Alphaproteobacteria bacterium]|jgi:hypothetical protein|nr:hypothetical protein [Alphaproteobacteria bacterium]